ncbi:J domain-containing protein [Nocardia sp. NPDC127579]|uniref:J domain-containing protein n=1 Tax=Nocardia sp. NPDC127579 TaxID=3345402 RepID=UPI003633D561
MDNYYELLGISPTAQPDAVRGALTEAQRLWLRRTALPDLDRRQEAEQMVRRIDRAKAVLLDPVARSAYDRKLAPPRDSPPGRTPPRLPTVDESAMPVVRPYAPVPFGQTGPAADDDTEPTAVLKDSKPSTPDDPMLTISLALSAVSLLSCPGMIGTSKHVLATLLVFLTSSVLNLWGLGFAVAGARRTVRAGGSWGSAGPALGLAIVGLSWIVVVCLVDANSSEPIFFR